MYTVHRRRSLQVKETKEHQIDVQEENLPATETKAGGGNPHQSRTQHKARKRRTDPHTLRRLQKSRR